MLITDTGTGVITESIRGLFDRGQVLPANQGKKIGLLQPLDPGDAKAEATWLEKLKRLT